MELRWWDTLDSQRPPSHLSSPKSLVQSKSVFWFTYSFYLCIPTSPKQNKNGHITKQFNNLNWSKKFPKSHVQSGSSDSLIRLLVPSHITKKTKIFPQEYVTIQQFKLMETGLYSSVIWSSFSFFYIFLPVCLLETLVLTVTHKLTYISNTVYSAVKPSPICLQLSSINSKNGKGGQMTRQID